MSVFGIGVCALCAAIFSAVVKTRSREMAFLLTLGAGVLILLSVLEELGPLLSQLGELAETSGLSSQPLTAVLKAVGIALAGRLTAGFCRDAGEASLGTAVELAVRVAILAVSLPLLTQILALIREVLS